MYQLLDNGVLNLTTKDIVKPGTPEWLEYQKWLTNGGILVPNDPIGVDNLDTAKNKKCAEIDSYAASLRNKVIAGRSVGELASWAMKLLDMISVSGSQSGPFSSIMPQVCTLLNIPATDSLNSAIALVRGITPQEQLEKVKVQSIPYIAAEIAIDGTRGKHCDAIRACSDISQVIVYNWKTGWPNI